MARPHDRQRRRPLVRSTIAALALAVPATAAVTAAPVASAADGDPTIDLVGKDHLRVRTYDGRAYTDFGLALHVTGAPLEIWSQRPSYDDQVVVTEGAPGSGTAFPAGVTDHLGVLDDFVDATFVSTTKPDAQPFTRHLAACIGENAVRTSPDAMFSSPYPQGCYYNPYAIGAVQGIPAGWRGSILSRWASGGVKLRPDTYTATLTIADAYADTLGLPADQREVTTTVVVRKADNHDHCRGCRTNDPGLQLPQGNDVPPTPEATEPTGPGIASVDDLPPGTPVPDLRTLPAFGITLNSKGTQLRFAANVWNGGTSDMVVDGFRREGEDVMDAYQYFLDSDGNVVAYQPVGTMQWDADPTHMHWHFTDFATYRLVKHDDHSTVVTSGKESFCLANTDAVDMTGEGAKWTTRYDDLGSVCGGYNSESIREALAAGWGDTYAQYRAGQAFAIKNVPDGVYDIEVLANPEGNLFEGDTTNNASYRTVKLTTNAKGERKLKVLPVGIIDDESNVFGY